jgi:hypothetical protein
VKREEVLAKRLAFDGDGIDFDGGKLNQTPNKLHINGFTSDEMFRGFDPEDPNLNLMAMPLGDLNAGE